MRLDPADPSVAANRFAHTDGSSLFTTAFSHRHSLFQKKAAVKRRNP